ncbi:hypothetical protein ACWPKO_27335 (plasmid) [Coraliomargarita sp. W4R53]
MRSKRAGWLLLVALVAVVLSGCAADPDLSSLEDSLSDVAGVEGALTYATHSGAPWNTQIVAVLFVDEASVDSVTEVVRAVVPALASDDITSSSGVGVFVSEDEPIDYETYGRTTPMFFDSMPSVAKQLGVDSPGNALLTLTPEDLAALAVE